MKCPKCGYNTFEFLNTCKKCGRDLASFKESLGIRPIVLSSRQNSPPTATVSPAPDTTMGFAADSEAGEGTGKDMFSWDTPEASPSPGKEGVLDVTNPAETLEESFVFEQGSSTEPPELFGEFSFSESGNSQQAAEGDAAESTVFAVSRSAEEGSIAPETGNFKELSFGDLPGFGENPAGGLSGNGATMPSSTTGEFALDDFFQEEERTGSPLLANTPHPGPESLSPGEFDLLLEDEPVVHKGGFQG